MDLFRNRDYVFTGKHSEMIGDLCVWKIFPSYVSILPVAAILGLLMGRYVEKDDNDKNDVRPCKIHYGELARNSNLILKSFQLVILNTDVLEIAYGERINRLFRASIPKDEDREIWDSYVRGGIEYLHDEISADQADTSEDRVRNLREIVKEIDRKNSAIKVKSVLEVIDSVKMNI